MNIIENNKLIARFMGAKKTSNCSSNELWIPRQTVCKTDTVELGRGNIIKYHKSWDWLMPVVEKIESFIFDEDNSYNVTIGSTNYCVIQDSCGDTIEIIKDCGRTKIETTHKAVVEFIKWYNENKD